MNVKCAVHGLTMGYGLDGNDFVQCVKRKNLSAGHPVRVSEYFGVPILSRVFKPIMQVEILKTRWFCAC